MAASDGDSPYSFAVTIPWGIASRRCSLVCVFVALDLPSSSRPTSETSNGLRSFVSSVLGTTLASAFLREGRSPVGLWFPSIGGRPTDDNINAGGTRHNEVCSTRT